MPHHSLKAGLHTQGAWRDYEYENSNLLVVVAGPYTSIITNAPGQTYIDPGALKLGDRWFYQLKQ
jgi:hypothetical protein